MLTEEQAREKQCRQPGQWGGLMCSASKCMAWRPVEEHEERCIAADSPEAATINQGYVTIDGGTWFIDHSRSDLDTFLVVNVDLTAKRGYCGAFGRPGDA